jgi:hypothetical protein
MVRQPGVSLQAVMTMEIVRDTEDIALWIVHFDVLEQLNGVSLPSRTRSAP